jgi:hypothetical protein
MILFSPIVNVGVSVELKICDTLRKMGSFVSQNERHEQTLRDPNACTNCCAEIFRSGISYFAFDKERNGVLFEN